MPRGMGGSNLPLPGTLRQRKLRRNLYEGMRACRGMGPFHSLASSFEPRSVQTHRVRKTPFHDIGFAKFTRLLPRDSKRRNTCRIAPCPITERKKIGTFLQLEANIFFSCRKINHGMGGDHFSTIDSLVKVIYTDRNMQGARCVQKY